MQISRADTEVFPQVISWANDMVLDTENAQPENCWVAKSRTGELRGFVREIAHPNCLELGMLGVVPNHRHLGVGKALVYFMQKKHKELYVVCVIPHYFSSMGFQIVTKAPVDLTPKLTNCAYWHGYGVPVVMRWHLLVQLPNL